MSWEIKVWHEDLGDLTRVSIEAGAHVPDEVISTVAGSYWFEEVQYGGAGWEDEDAFDAQESNPTGRLQG